ncbi:MAG: hypothetical protein K8R63_05780 [Bacteroidales bacterium]|nr:hypothetical protein [Bacteroidales bacterium]
MSYDILLCIINTDTRSIIISLVSASAFAVIMWGLKLAFDFYRQYNNQGKYIRRYDMENESLKGEILALAIVKYRWKKEMSVQVTTFINVDSNLPDNEHYKFPDDKIEKWEGRITMENKEAGKVYWYYIAPPEKKSKDESGFKRVLFMDKAKTLKLFGEGIYEERRVYGDEIFKREKNGLVVLGL